MALLALSACLPLALASAAPAAAFFTHLDSAPLFAREGATATPLPGGEILIAGGGITLTSRTAELFDPTTKTFTEVPGLMRHVRGAAVAAPLPDGDVLIAGGLNNVAYTNAEIYDPTSGTFGEAPGEMTVPRLSGIAAPLPDGDILIAGGWSEGESQRSAEIFHSATGTFSALAARPVEDRSDAVATALPDGRVLIVGGEGAEEQTAEVFDPATDVFSLLGPAFEGAESGAAGTVLPDGKALLSGGLRGNLESKKADVFDPSGPKVERLAAEPTTERSGAAAALLPEGKVLISGGGWPEATQSAELFVPAPEIGYSGADLGERIIGQPSSPGSVAVTNVGAQPLHIQAVSLAGASAGFALTSDSCSGRSLVFGAGCAIGVTFTPASVGPAHALLQFTDNEPTPTTIQLSATAVTPASPSGGSPAGDPGARPVSSVRHGGSVGCETTRPRRRKVVVICQVELGGGNWDLRLRHGGRVVATRRVAGGPHRLRFIRPRDGRGGYLLRFTPTN